MDEHDKTTHEGYDVLAEDTNHRREGWERPWGDNPLQKYYSWPATRSILPEVADRRVLNAGCGIGDHVPWLLEEGGVVVGIDVSNRAVKIARKRYGERALFHQTDLTEPLDFADDSSFDIVLSHLALDHIGDWRGVFEEFNRVLTGDGTLVFTVIHPMQYYLDYEAVSSYYERTPVEVSWPDAPVTSYHRPLSQMLNSLTEAGFCLDVCKEPKPPDEYEEHADDRWKVDERPQILCIRARSRQHI